MSHANVLGFIVSVADVATRAGTIFLCLPGEPQVRSVCLERDGLVAHARAGQTSST